MTEPLCLTDLQQQGAGKRGTGLRRPTPRGLLRVLRRSVFLGTEVLRALPHDVIRLLTKRHNRLTRMEDGSEPGGGATRIALYVHYSANGLVSGMVRYQLDLLRQAGFATVFISMAATIPEADWHAVRGLCALAVQRRNFGRDFGAWQDVLPEVRRRWGVPDELMLVNDSVLGPIRPMAPVLAAMRAGGDGLFGLTESLQGGPHLQSYMLLARGRAVAADLMRFVESMFVSHSKWLLIELGEIRLSRWMRGQGHRVAALFGYDRLVRAVLRDPHERKRVIASNWHLRGLGRLPEDRCSALLDDWPLNPTHHLWHILAEQFDFPFLKTELVARNPGRLADVGEWPSVVRSDSPCPVPMLRAHLASVGAA